jgi:hypothetical protein
MSGQQILSADPGKPKDVNCDESAENATQVIAITYSGSAEASTPQKPVLFTTGLGRTIEISGLNFILISTELA